MFVKGDPNINRKGRPKNAESQALRDALAREAETRKKPFWDHVASVAYEDTKVMIAVLKKFIPDMTSTEIEGLVNVMHLPQVTLKDGKPLDPEIGDPLPEEENEGT